MPIEFLRRAEVLRLTGLSISTLYEMMSRGDFPRPFHISPRSVAWLASEVHAWQKARIAERDSEKKSA